MIDVPHRDDLLDAILPIDVRALGLAYYADLFRATPFPEVWGNYRQTTPSYAREVEPDVFEIVWVMESDRSERVARIDRSRGYWPVRLEVRHRGADYLVNELEVQEFEGMWLPVRYSSKVSDRGVDYEFEWKRINDPIDAEEFAYGAFDRTGIRRVVDRRLGDSIVVERWDLAVPVRTGTKCRTWRRESSTSGAGRLSSTR